MGAISAAKGVTQIDNNSAMAGPEQIMKLGDELARLDGESVETLADLPPLGSLSLNDVANWPGRTVYVISELASYTWSGTAWTGGAIARFSAWNTNTPVARGSAAIIMTGLAAGKTTSTGVLVHSFPVPFPNGCVSVDMHPHQNSNMASFPLLVEGQVTAAGFQSFWGGRGTADVRTPYTAWGY